MRPTRGLAGCLIPVALILAGCGYGPEPPSANAPEAEKGPMAPPQAPQPPQPPPQPKPAPEPAVIASDGLWHGQGTGAGDISRVSFTVEGAGAAIKHIAFSGQARLPDGRPASGEYGFRKEGPYEIRDGRFAIVTNKFRIAGRFVDPSRASGELHLRSNRVSSSGEVQDVTFEGEWEAKVKPEPPPTPPGPEAVPTDVTYVPPDPGIISGYLGGALGAARRVRVMAALYSVNQWLRTQKMQAGRYPKDMQELMRLYRRDGARLEQPPAQYKYFYWPTHGVVKMVRVDDKRFRDPEGTYTLRDDHRWER